MDRLKEEIAAVAARLVVEEGQDYAAAKRHALRQLGVSARTALPDNRQVEWQVEQYIATYCGQTQPGELRVLRQIALHWMQKLQRFRPHLAGAVWHGTATRQTDITLQLFSDDPKSAEIALVDMGVRYQPRTITGFQGAAVEALSVQVLCPEFQHYVGVHLVVYDFDDLRGARKPDAQGRMARGDQTAVRELMHDAGL
ncbi:MAG: hypothetical protein ACR2I0_15060 [Rhodoferax sp.]